MGKLLEITDPANIESVTVSGVTVIDFWAPWCGPCKRQAQILEELADEIHYLTGIPVNIYKLDVDQFPDVAKQFHIRSIPYIAVFKDGKAEEFMTGLQRKEAIIDSVKRVAGS